MGKFNELRRYLYILRKIDRFNHRIAQAVRRIVKFVKVASLIQFSPAKLWEVGTNPKEIERTCDEKQRRVAINLPLIS